LIEHDLTSALTHRLYGRRFSQV